ncbi:MAG: T9SS type A sorting domain-containing protein, partial [bacterium]
IKENENDNDYTDGVIYGIYDVRYSYASDAYSYRFEAKNNNNVEAIGEATTIHSGPKVEGVNYSPLLLWTGESDYTDGCNPDSGAPDTPFTFHTAYLDINVDPPAPDYPAVLIYKDDKPYGIGTYTMDYVNGSYFKGATYSKTIFLNATGTYKYKFYAKDNKGEEARGPFTILRVGPKVSHTPKLEWAGQTGFQTDGLEPHEGIVRETYFTFKVKYKDEDGDAPLADYPKICILNNDKLVGKAKMVVESGNDFKTGKIYFCIFRLNEVSDKYEYYFEAKDAMGVAATGTPTYEHPGPTVKEKPPSSPQFDPLQTLEFLEIFNYPNPHTGKTTICARTNLNNVPVTMQVEVFNIIGELIWQIEKNIDVDNDGIARIEWNSQNEHIASGIYIYKLRLIYNGKTLQKINKMGITR